MNCSDINIEVKKEQKEEQETNSPLVEALSKYFNTPPVGLELVP